MNFLKNEQLISNFFYLIIPCEFMLSQEDNEFIEKLVKWAELIGVNLDRDLEQVHPKNPNSNYSKIIKT